MYNTICVANDSITVVKELSQTPSVKYAISPAHGVSIIPREEVMNPKNEVLPPLPPKIRLEDLRKVQLRNINQLRSNTNETNYDVPSKIVNNMGQHKTK